MNNKEIRAKLKEEFNSVVPNVLDKVMDNSLVNQPIYASKPVKRFFPKRILSFSCALATVFVFGIGFSNIYYQVSASISIDINPSINVNVNKFDRVIEVKAYNSEAEAVIHNLKLRNSTTDNAINTILLSAKEKGYIADTNDNAILFSVWADNERDVNRLESSIQACIGSHHNINSEIRFENIDIDTYHHAQSTNASCGKIKLVDDIIQHDSNLDEKELLSKPVKELFEVYDRCQNMQSQGHHDSMGNYTDQPQTTPSTPNTQNISPQNTQEPVTTLVPTVPRPQNQMQHHNEQNGHRNGKGMHR